MIIFKISSPTNHTSKVLDDPLPENEYVCSTSKKMHFETIMKRNIELVGDVIGSNLTKLSFPTSRSQVVFDLVIVSNSKNWMGQISIENSRGHLLMQKTLDLGGLLRPIKTQFVQQPEYFWTSRNHESKNVLALYESRDLDFVQFGNCFVTGQDSDAEMIKPGIVLESSRKSKSELKLELHGSTHSAFTKWICLDRISILIPEILFDEKHNITVLESSGMSSIIFINIGREIAIYSLLTTQSRGVIGSGTVQSEIFPSFSPKGQFKLLKSFNSPSSIPRPSIIKRLDETQFGIVCGKSLVVWKHAPFSPVRPVYSPENLQSLINLGKISQVKKILDLLKTHPKFKQKISTESTLLENFFESRTQEILEYPLPSISDLLSDHFEIIAGEETSTKQDRDDDLKMDFTEVETIEEELKLSFDSESEGEDEKMKSEENYENITVDSILMRFPIAGLDRTDQVILFYHFGIIEWLFRFIYKQYQKVYQLQSLLVSMNVAFHFFWHFQISITFRNILVVDRKSLRKLIVQR